MFKAVFKVASSSTKVENLDPSEKTVSLEAVLEEYLLRNK